MSPLPGWPRRLRTQHPARSLSVDRDRPPPPYTWTWRSRNGNGTRQVCQYPLGSSAVGERGMPTSSRLMESRLQWPAVVCNTEIETNVEDISNNLVLPCPTT